LACNHNWEPIPSVTDAGLISDGFYRCINCKIIGSRNDVGQIQMERCQGFNCIAPATKVTQEGMPLCERCYNA
jgi:hypothetical protein